MHPQPLNTPELRMKADLLPTICAGLLLALSPRLSAGADYSFEDLGEPLRIRNLGLQFVTRKADGGFMAWGRYESHEKKALVGVQLNTGEITWVDLTHFGLAHMQAAQGADGHIYLYAGSPGHFSQIRHGSGPTVGPGRANQARQLFDWKYGGAGWEVLRGHVSASLPGAV